MLLPQPLGEGEFAGYYVYMAKKKTLPAADALFKSAFADIVENGASKFSIARVSEDLNIEEALLAPVFNDLPSLALAFGRYVDVKIAKDVGEPSDEPARDRLFEALMARFDVLQDYRDGIEAVLKYARREPPFLQLLLSRVPYAMEHILEVVGVKAKGPRGRLQVAGLSLVYLRAYRVWSKDDSDDMAKTMASLDKSLKDADSIARRFF